MKVDLGKDARLGMPAFSRWCSRTSHVNLLLTPRLAAVNYSIWLALTPQTHTRCPCKDKLFAQLIPRQSSLTYSLISLLQAKLPPGANRILFVKNLNYQITGEDLYDLFGRYGSIRQIRIGSEPKTKGTAFVVFDDVMDVRSVFLSFSSPPSSPPPCDANRL
jgi:hypothetical protein